ncbi:acyl-CoA dehydrogenase family protein [Actinosynnema sp. CS-041913]|uniref:acyl-CoA dehydrogenase family protein n=1 Tax=Actinosynnema sp. CS-041913 TaxID=3239917 RepID=UPI003D8B1E55
MLEYERLAHADGLAAGLRAALEGVDARAVAPGEVVAVAEVPAGADVVAHSLAEAEGIAFVRSAADREYAADTALAVAAARLGGTRRLLDQAVEHLSGRESGGEPLTRKQLLVGAVGDLVTAAGYARHLLAAARPVAADIAETHDRITDIDWQVAMLFGANGYLAEHPARGAHVSALVANTWVSGR